VSMNTDVIPSYGRGPIGGVFLRQLAKRYLHNDIIHGGEGRKKDD